MNQNTILSRKGNDYFERNRRRIGRHDMPHNERSRKPTVSGINEERTCLLGGGAGRSPIDRVIGGLRERKGDWKIRKFWTANANPEDRPNLVDPI